MHINNRRQRCFVKRTISVVVAGALSGGMAAAYADADAGALEEVVITAQKRSENLQDVPISVMSFDAKALETKGVLSLSDINDGSVPGLNLAPYPGSSDIFFPTFRGITTNSAFISAPNPIAVHVNGVYLSQLVGLNNPAADLERIEVLKGPQGVMSGRNATGGAINIITAKPEIGLFGFKQQITLAQRGQVLSKTSVNIPLTDALAAKIAYVNSTRDNEGVKNSAPGGVKFGQRDAEAWRLDLRWKPINGVTVDYGYDYSKSQGYDTPPQCLLPGNAVAYRDPSGATLAFLAGIDPRVNTFAKGCSGDKQSSLYFPYALQKNQNQAEGHTLNIEWEASPTLTIRSITGYRKVDTSNNFNYGAYAGGADMRSDSGPFVLTGVGGLTLGNPIKLYNESWSQEFQFLGDLSKTFKYTAGLYYATEKGYQHSGPNIGIYILDGGALLGGTDLLMVDNKGLHSSKSDSMAVFGQVNWTPDILDQKLEIVPGIRFTKDHRRVDGYNTGWDAMYAVTPTGVGTAAINNTIPIPGIGFASAIGDRRYSQATPALSFNYHWNDSLMNYLKFSKGYTSGGFDPVAGPATAATFVKGFDPETIKSIELGFKGEFLDRRLRTNAALFQSKFTKEQKTVSIPAGGWNTQNVGGSTYKGLEFDVTAAVTQNLRATLSYSTLSHKYDNWTDPFTGADVTSQRKLIVPKNDYSVSVDYRFPDFGLPGKLDGNLSYSHRSATSTPFNPTLPNGEFAATTPAFSVLNGRLALSHIKVGPDSHGDLTVALWGKNLADKKYLIMVNQGWVTDRSGNWGEPRTLGMDLIYQYY